jgi:hypothetical protein
MLNLSSLLGSPTRSETPYDRIAGHPVFSITTPWGSPYMSMEKLSDVDDIADTGGSKKSMQSISEEQNEYRTVCLYFLDPDDALQLHGEMKQMESMGQADLRVTTFSMSKALRQAANLGNGLVTGAPIDATDGRLPIEEGGALRYKIVPPKRQLYYAARCTGRERVGLFADQAAEDAQTAVLGNIDGQNLIRRREKMERKTPKTSGSRTALQQQYAHMEGYTGIPVFYAPEMRRVLPWLKRITCANKMEIPMFFDYEDLMEAWDQMQQRKSKKRGNNDDIPTKPTDVEVFNLWDVLTSMDREAYKQRQQTSFLQRHVVRPIQSRVTALSPSSVDKEEPGLGHITFIPSSRSVQYKEGISARGNGKARLKPMR